MIGIVVGGLCLMAQTSISTESYDLECPIVLNTQYMLTLNNIACQQDVINKNDSFLYMHFLTKILFHYTGLNLQTFEVIFVFVFVPTW